MQEKDPKQLLKKVIDGSATAEEKAILNSWYFNWNKDIPSLLSQEDHEKAKATIYARLPKADSNVRIRKLWPRIAVTAAVLIVVFGAGLFYYSTQLEKQANVVAYGKDINPGRNGATLTLANGQKILINEALAGNIANQTGVKISKTKEGQIIYEIVGDNSNKLEYNTLSTARGEQTQVRLPDGSLVFLNAASTLKYPTRFTNLQKREVSLIGEGYFEIAKDKAHPFVVSTEKQKIEVLGTHFNINSYADEAYTKTTLLEGSVKIVPLSYQDGSKPVILKPDQQSVLTDNSLKIDEVNSENAIAWKNGLFVFEDEPLQDIMKRVSRWYNVEIVYENGVNKNTQFWGSVSRYDKVSKVLEGLELTKGVHFKIEEGRITVMK